ncbi:MAG: hypothetical protein ACRDBQ_22240 [Shewanella sp.]
MEKMREEFERWFYDNAGLKCKFDSYDNAYVTASSKTTGDTIVNTSCCIAWQSWKASRAALNIFIPPGIRESHFIEIISQLRSSGANWS